MVLADDIVIENLENSLGVGMPSRNLPSEDFSSWMMSLHSSTHSSQMYTVGPAMSLRTSCWLLPQNEQWRVSFESLLVTLLILAFLNSVPPGGALMAHRR
jgi:hypothetical protein